MKTITLKKVPKLFSTCLFLFMTTALFAQVGINTITPGDGSIMEVNSSDKGIFIPRVDITDLSTIAPVTGIPNNPADLLAAEGLLVYNTNTTTGPGFFYWGGTTWTAVNPGSVPEPAIDSVTLTTDETLDGTGYTDIPGMSLTFTARKTSVMVNLTASGFGTTNSVSIAYLRVYNVTSTSVLGGTLEKVQSHLEKGPPGAFSVYTTTWSSSYSTLLTGLTIGNSYTIKVQGYAEPVTTGGSAVIRPVTVPDSNHLTLSVTQ
ncbi:MAG: hypothetical protein KJO39_00170 [Bacteroidia bacterium]|nr:hypothetical protein [Bacteroidia bacterium]NNJ81654.1 hypothetical protein [Flavobacteriaceae bacterium]NNK54810.1 hypothetical protein [Flavobacteriaceae bacterium]NNM09051.1 hypothetical protein [Flavobacteriaceae bacterium]